MNWKPGFRRYDMSLGPGEPRREVDKRVEGSDWGFTGKWWRDARVESGGVGEHSGTSYAVILQETPRGAMRNSHGEAA